MSVNKSRFVHEISGLSGLKHLAIVSILLAGDVGLNSRATTRLEWRFYIDGQRNPEEDISIHEYENYDQTSVVYDSTRVPIGVDLILDALAGATPELSDQTVLDAGCGTGNYLLALADKIGTLHGLDLNAGMLKQAEGKTDSLQNVSLREGGIENLPYDTETFDGVLSNQVIHHVSDGDASANDFESIRQVVKSAHDVLKQNGALVFNISSHEQIRTGFWWASLIPEAIEVVVKRSPSLDVLQRIMEETGFERVGTVVPMDALLQGDEYFDAVGPLKKSWRDGDSTWSLASEKELASAIDKVTKNQEDGNADQYLSNHDETRKRIGQTTCLFGYKS